MRCEACGRETTNDFGGRYTYQDLVKVESRTWATGSEHRFFYRPEDRTVNYSLVVCDDCLEHRRATLFRRHLAAFVTSMILVVILVASEKWQREGEGWMVPFLFLVPFCFVVFAFEARRMHTDEVVGKWKSNRAQDAQAKDQERRRVAEDGIIPMSRPLGSQLPRMADPKRSSEDSSRPFRPRLPK